jgi:hypothetical protein
VQTLSSKAKRMLIAALCHLWIMLAALGAFATLEKGKDKTAIANTDSQQQLNKASSQDAIQAQAAHVVIEGHWAAAAEIGATRWSIGLTIAKNSEGKIVATIDAPDARRVQVDSIEQAGNKLKLTITNIGASFHGELNAAGSEINGVWQEGTVSLPIRFLSPKGKGGVIGSLVEPPVQNWSKAPSAESAGFQDEAAFSFLVDEQPAGVVESSWATDGSFESHSIVTRSGQTIQISTKVLPDKDGRWAKIIAGTSLNTTTVARGGTKIVCTIGKNAAVREIGANNLMLLDYNSPALLSQVLRIYDRSKGGVQQFSSIQIPPEFFPNQLTVEAKETTEHTVGGNHLLLTRFHCKAENDMLEVLPIVPGRSIWSNCRPRTLFSCAWGMKACVLESKHPSTIAMRKCRAGTIGRTRD